MREEGEILALLPQAVAGDTDIGDSVEPGEAAEQRRCGRTKRRPDRAAKRGVETAGGGRLQGDRRWNAKAGGGLADHLARLEQAIVAAERSEGHTSELQSLMRISYAVFCLKKK